MMNNFLIQLAIIFLIVISQHTQNYNIRDIFVLSFIFYMNVSSNKNFNRAIYDSAIISLIYIGGILFLKKYIYQTEGFVSGKKHGKKHGKKNVKKHKKMEDFMDDDDDTELFLDTKNTILDIYKGLGHNELKGLNSDTKELMKTQKSLISTLQTMGPVLDQGKDIISSFNNYFGSDDDLNQLLKSNK